MEDVNELDKHETINSYNIFKEVVIEDIFDNSHNEVYHTEDDIDDDEQLKPIFQTDKTKNTGEVTFDDLWLQPASTEMEIEVNYSDSIFKEQCNTPTPVLNNVKEVGYAIKAYKEKSYNQLHIVKSNKTSVYSYICVQHVGCNFFAKLEVLDSLTKQWL
jgi:hypothetical protein